MAAVAHVQPLRAKIPRRRGVRTRVGVPTTLGLERDLRKARAARRARLPRGTPSDDLDEVEDAEVSPTTREPEDHAGLGILLIFGLVAGVIYHINKH